MLQKNFALKNISNKSTLKKFFPSLIYFQVSLDDIFTLFGVYGDVVRVKILYSKQETALVQFATPQQR